MLVGWLVGTHAHGNWPEDTRGGEVISGSDILIFHSCGFTPLSCVPPSSNENDVCICGIFLHEFSKMQPMQVAGSVSGTDPKMLLCRRVISESDNHRHFSPPPPPPPSLRHLIARPQVISSSSSQLWGHELISLPSSVIVDHLHHQSVLIFRVIVIKFSIISFLRLKTKLNSWWFGTSKNEAAGVAVMHLMLYLHFLFLCRLHLYLYMLYSLCVFFLDKKDEKRKGGWGSGGQASGGRP